MEHKKQNLEDLDEMIKMELQQLLSEIKTNKKTFNIIVEKPDGTVEEWNDTNHSKEYRLKKADDEAIIGFQSYYKTLTTNQSYALRKWLKSILLKDLTLTEIEEITSRIVSASNGFKNRKDPTKKPK